MSPEDPIDAAFRERRAAQAEQVHLQQVKKELSAVRQASLEDVRDRILLPVLEQIAQAFERNGSAVESSSNISESDSRAGGERRFLVPGREAGQTETLTVAAVAVRTDPTSDSFRVSAQVAERREHSDAYTFAKLREVPGTEELIRTWTAGSLERLVVERLQRRGM
ncbi:MAG: hypothetical protein M3552_17810 [Planctomycetota bacterium]|nr:hypothetical protein [Planctomycetaceae bacterium]MDQ3332477.1 hypothetical protein [Planctomycetota bacterium]